MPSKLYVVFWVVILTTFPALRHLQVFREKMLFACVVGDDTISSFESNLDEFPLDGVLTQLPPELTLTEAAANCERISTDALRKSKTVNPLTNVDFDAINPKLMYKEDRFWYRVPVRSPPLGEGFFQDDPQRMVMFSRCSASKGTSNEFDVFAEAARFCPNCASNFCRKFYLTSMNPHLILPISSLGGQPRSSFMKKNCHLIGESLIHRRTSGPGSMRQSERSEPINLELADLSHISVPPG